MTGLILLAIAVAIISAVTIDLLRPNRSEAVKAYLDAEEKERRRRVERRPQPPR